MHDQATNALIAVALGSVLAVVLLIPVAAVQYLSLIHISEPTRPY